MKHTDLTDQQKQEALATGRCPVCTEPMKKFTTTGAKSDELYCETDHLSVLLK